MNLQAIACIKNFHKRIMRYSCLLGDKYKFTANASNKDHKITKIHHFAA